MFCYNPLNFSKPKMILFYCDILQIIGCLFDLGSTFFVTINGLNTHSTSFQLNFVSWLLVLAVVIICIAGVVTASISLFGLYSDNHQLLMPNIIYCISISFPTTLNLLHSLGHVDILMMFITAAGSLTIILGIVVGITAFNESKAINKKRIVTQSFAQPQEEATY